MAEGQNTASTKILSLEAIPLIKYDFLEEIAEESKLITEAYKTAIDNKAEELWNNFKNASDEDKQVILDQLTALGQKDETLTEGVESLKSAIQALNNKVDGLEQPDSVLSEDEVKDIISAALVDESFWTNDAIGAPTLIGNKIVSLVGLFGKVKAENIEDHEMHSEHYHIPKETADLINKTLKSLGLNGENKSRRIEYQIVGRYMTGSDVTGYHLQSIDTGKSGKFTKDQVCFLVGRGQITNCTAQLYNDKVLLRGNGIKLDDLPVIREDGELRNSEGLGKIRKGTSAIEAVEMFNIVGTIKAGSSVVGYVIQNAGGGIKRIKRPQLLQLASAGKIGNARVQNNNGEILLRGVGVNLDELPTENISAKGENSNAPKRNKTFEAICKELKATGKSMHCPMLPEIETPTRLKLVYHAGYIDFELKEDMDTFRFDWSAANRFDGGEANGKLSEDEAELRAYIEERFRRIWYLMIH